MEHGHFSVEDVGSYANWRAWVESFGFEGVRGFDHQKAGREVLVLRDCTG